MRVDSIFEFGPGASSISKIDRNLKYIPTYTGPTICNIQTSNRNKKIGDRVTTTYPFSMNTQNFNLYDPHNKEQSKPELPGLPKYSRLESLVEENEQAVSKHPEGAACTAMDNVALELCRPKLWQKLYTETTEMIVNESGRQMSPPISVRISGLEKGISYAIWVHFQRDGNAWAWCPQEMKWKVNGVDDTINEPIDHPQKEFFCHQWITASGDKWMGKPISFQNLRLTSDPKNTRDVFLYPNHRYTPVVYLVPLDGQKMITNSPVSFFPLDLAQFICSKSYRNRNMACLKIELNPRSREIHSRGRQQALQRQNNHTSEENNLSDDCVGCIQTGVRYGFLPNVETLLVVI